MNSIKEICTAITDVIRKAKAYTIYPSERLRPSPPWGDVYTSVSNGLMKVDCCFGSLSDLGLYGRATITYTLNLETDEVIDMEASVQAGDETYNVLVSMVDMGICDWREYLEKAFFTARMLK